MKPEGRPRGIAPLERLLKLLCEAVAVDFALLLFLLFVHAGYPSPSFITPIEGFFLVLVALSTCLVGGAVAYAWVRFPGERRAIFLIGLIVAATLAAHLYAINEPSTADGCTAITEASQCIGDEAYYVPAAQIMLEGSQCGLVNGSPTPPNCNLEHPFLSKAFIAAGIAVFGDNTFGWRIFQVLLGAFSIPLLFMLALKLSGNRRLACISAALLALDVMFFAQSGAALIDVQMIFFALLAFVAYFYRVRLWKFDSLVVSGVLMGLAGLCKETAVFLALTLLTYHVVVSASRRPGGSENARPSVRSLLVSTGKIAAAGCLTFFFGLQVYDTLFASHAFPLFVDQIRYMLSIGASLTGPGYTYGASNTPITPFNWLFYYPPISYFSSTVSPCLGSSAAAGLCAGASYTDIGYYSITNMLETWMVFLWVPLVLVTLSMRDRILELVKEGIPSLGGWGPLSAGELKLGALAVIWFGWNYFSYLLLFLAGRTTYPFYFLTAVPAVAMGAAYFLTRARVPRKVVYVYIAFVFVFFLVFFPYKAFLPVYLRQIIGW